MFVTMAGSLGVGGVVGSGSNIDGCNAESEPMEILPSLSNCGMAHFSYTSAPSWQFGSSTGCGHFHFCLAGGVGGDRLVTAPALPAAAATSFLLRHTCAALLLLLLLGELLL